MLLFVLLGILGAAFVITAVVATRDWTRTHIRETADQQTQLALELSSALRDYVGHAIRPEMEKHVGPDEFVVEAMSTSYVARKVFEAVRQRFPNYMLRFPSTNPRNPKNQASEAEIAVIRYFERHPEAEYWTGTIAYDGEAHYVRATPRRFDASCLRCHGDPQDAPPSIVARYGPAAGFGRSVGDLSIDLVGVPVEDALAVAGLREHRRMLGAVILCAAFLLATASAIYLDSRRRRRATAALLETNNALKETTRRFETILGLTGTRIHIVDADYNLRFVDSAWQHVHGEPMGRKCHEYFVGSSKPCPSCGVSRALRTKEVTVTERTLASEHGRIGEAHAVPFQSESGEWLVAEFNIDVTERKSMELELRESQDRLSEVIGTAQDAIIMIDPVGRISLWNEAAARIFGYTQSEALGQNLHKLLAPARYYRDHVLAYEEFRRSGTGNAVGRAIELDAVRKGGTEFPIELSLSAVRLHNGWHAVGVIRDITERRQTEMELRRSARTDRLTGLPNRALLVEHLQRAVDRSVTCPEDGFAILFLDFDRFKIVNDSLGHQIGDRLLKEMAARLRACIRDAALAAVPGERHTIARLGGDEFVVLLDGVGRLDDVCAIADDALSRLALPYQVGGYEFHSTASMGIVTHDVAAHDANEILRDADTAMYAAKSTGRGRYVVFDNTMREQARVRLDLEIDLRKAVAERQFRLVYQPIVCLETCRIESYEALLRWPHPKRGLIPPAEFLPIAEDTGLILSIGEWVLHEACRQLVEWRRMLGNDAPRSVSVNLSRSQLQLTNLRAVIQRMLDEHGLSPSCLHLEVTESTVMRNEEQALVILQSLADLGVSLDMDDFGTGHSSLACLRELPFNVLKIDRSFIANVTRGRDFASLVHAIVSLARNLDMQIVAEGIENIEQLMIMQSFDCHFGQGYLIGGPMPPDQAAAHRVPTFTLPGQAAEPATAGTWA